MRIGIILALIVVLSIPIVYGAMSTTPLLVCGHNPESLAGYGEVKVWGFYFSCDNVPDGVCPEDYQDAFNSTIFGDCSSCADPDCTGNITGTVFDYKGVPIDNAAVTAHPIKWNQSAPSMETSVNTAVGGSYNLIAPTGRYYFVASKDSYDNLFLMATITRNGVSYLNFSLNNGTCNDDCTDSGNNCKAACDGLTFEGGSRCTFDNAKTRELCDNRTKGTDVLYDTIPGNDTHAWFVNCCEAAPVIKYYAKAQTDSSKIKDLVQIEKVANLNGDPVKVIVAVFNTK